MPIKNRALKSLSIALLILSLLSFNIYTNPTEQRFASWNNVTLIGAFGKHKKFRFLAHQDTRFASIDNVFEQSITGGAIGYKINDKVSAWMGYFGFLFYIARLNTYFGEHRTWQQILWTLYKSQRLKVISRTILEERFVVNNPQTGWRIRQQLLLLLPNAIGKVGLITSEELFVPINHPNWAPDRLIDQNRLLIGFHFKVSKKTNMTIGYLNQILLGNTRNQMNHVLFFSLVFNLAPTSIPTISAESLSEIN